MAEKLEYRPPWFTLQVIGIAGASASGKTSVAKALVKRLNVPWVVLVSTDSFYKPLSREDSQRAFRNEFDFDAPAAWDWDLMVEKLSELKAGRKVEIPKYSFVKHTRLEETATVYGANVIILEGNLALYEPRILDLLDMKVVECHSLLILDSDVCLSRRLVRDINERGRDLEGILKQYFSFVKPSNENYVHKQAQIADIVIPHGPSNTKAIDLVAQHISMNLAQKSRQHMLYLESLAKEVQKHAPLPQSIVILEQTNQLKAMTTMIRDQECDREDFVFYLERVSSLVLERALDELSYVPKKIETPGGHEYNGLELSGKICGVEIVRAGGAMRTSFSRIFDDAAVGKILIHTSEVGEPLLHFVKLPNKISSLRVIVMDVQIATRFAATALMAIRILLDHGVPESHIIFITILASAKGLHALAKVFPEVKVIVADLDETLAGEGGILSGRWLGV